MKILISGATGHLGSNLVQHMADSGHSVLAIVRNQNQIDQAGLNRPGVEVISTDLLIPNVLDHVMCGVDVVFQCAANFSHWSRYPYRDIIDCNNRITANVLTSAHAAGVRRVVYVSSTGTLKRSLGEEKVGPDDWCLTTYGNPYFESKVQSERLAWKMADEYGLSMTAVLPSAMIGGSIIRETPTTRFIRSIYLGKVPYDLDFDLNLVSVEDVCHAMLQCVEHGKSGHRYILANSIGISMRRISEICSKYSHNALLPRKINKKFLLAIAGVTEIIGMLINKEPQLLRSNVRIYYGTTENYDISASCQDFCFTPQPIENILDDFIGRFN